MCICNICGLSYDPTSLDDQIIHKNEHKKLATGIQPRIVREFCKSYGWAVAHNNSVNNPHDPEIGKLVVVYSWWNRTLENGVQKKDFDSYMSAYLKLADALVSGNLLEEEKARKETKKWEKYAG